MAIKGSAQNVAKAIQRKEREFQPSPTSLKKHALKAKTRPILIDRNMLKVKRARVGVRK